MGSSSRYAATRLIPMVAGLWFGGATARPSPAPEGVSPAPARAPDADLEPLADGVFGFIRREPLGLAVNANSLIIVRDRDVVVVDAQFTRAATLETIAAIRRVTPKPVGAVVNTHWHDDHLGGNQVYQDSFPGVRFIMHANTGADLIALGGPNRSANVQGGPAAVERFDRLLAAGLGVDSTPVSDAERASLSSALGVVRQYLAEAPGFKGIAATDTVGDRLSLGGGPDPIEIRWFGCGNTRGDLVVHLPAQRIVATGDLVVAPVPFGFVSYPLSWPEVLDSVLALGPRIVVPGHGPVMRDLGYVRTVRDMLVAARDQAGAAAARGDSLSTALQTITLENYRREIAGDEKWMNYLFNRFFLRPVVRRAFEAHTASDRSAACR